MICLITTEYKLVKVKNYPNFILFSRLYENLPDIRQKAIEKQRQETYAANRAKAQEFQKVCKTTGYKVYFKATKRFLMICSRLCVFLIN